MGRLREKILPSLRAALEKLEENAETIPHEDSPNYLPRWDFSQSQAGYRIRKLTGSRPGISRNSTRYRLNSLITSKGQTHNRSLYEKSRSNLQLLRRITRWWIRYYGLFWLV